MAAVYDQNAGNATLYVDGKTVSSQTSIPHGGMVLRTASPAKPPLPPEDDSENTFVTALRIGAGGTVAGAADGGTGFIGLIDEAFIYGAALTLDELDFLFRAAQVKDKSPIKYQGVSFLVADRALTYFLSPRFQIYQN